MVFDLGSCPFCDGHVICDPQIEPIQDDEIIQYEYRIVGPECVKGCPLEDFTDDHAQIYETDVPDEYIARRYAEWWRGEVDAFNHRADCPTCRRRPRFAPVDEDCGLLLACRTCGIEAHADTMTGLVREWNRLAEETRRASERFDVMSDLAVRLNGEGDA